MAAQKYLVSEESTNLMYPLSSERSLTCVLEKRELANGLKRRIEEMEKKVFGYELVMDLSECDLSVMRSKKKLAEYVNKLCKLIKMKKYGKVQLPYFGLEKPQTKGYSLLQFIETSSITGHFSEYWRKSYINIFSCKPYNHRLAANFTKEFFGTKHAKIRFLVR
ncbi:MAG: S-adenosylmethionine decarboxylase [Candidatus Omnitrophica bacterium]|jgi:S-adenosylmethionine/arginine decarboxylase-like enzyme|nr:S-adenosylmethionine decarboxylase [Candidatus Omnitrophota bacterium]